MILTMCLNIGIDPEEWREEISKDVPSNIQKSGAFVRVKNVMRSVKLLF